MRVFVTGESDWIGSAVVPERLNVGRQVGGASGSVPSTAAFTAASAEVHRITLDDPDSLRGRAAAANGALPVAAV